MFRTIHYVDRYLPLTCNWIYSQIIFNKAPEQHVYCTSTENLDLFPIEQKNLHCWHQRGLHRKIWGRIAAQDWDKKLKGHFRATLRRLQPDIIHAHFGTAGWRALELSAELNIPLVTSFYGADISQVPRNEPLWRMRYRELFSQGDAFIAEGPALAKQLMRWGCPGEKIFINPIGVDTERIAFQPRRHEQDTFNVLIAATFREKKGIPYALQALAKLIRDYPQIRIRLVGDTTKKESDALEKAFILSLIDRYRLHDRIRMYGFVSNDKLHEIAAGCHVFLSPSVLAADGDNEGGCPVGIIEMGAAGLPVISSKHFDIPEVVKHGTTGYLTEERNVEELAGYIAQLINNRERLDTFAIAARKHVEAKYDVRVQAVRLGHIYRTVIEGDMFLGRREDEIVHA